MRRRFAIFAATVVLGGVLAGMQAVAADAPQPDTRAVSLAIAACLPRLDTELDVGFERIAARCPGLAEVLESSGVAAMLPADWRQARGELSAGGLRALRAALLAASEPAARRAPPDTAVLESLVAASSAATATPGLGQRLLRWLRARVEHAASGARGPSEWLGWLEQGSVSQRVWATLGYLALLGLVVFLGWVLRAELYASGWLGRPRATAAGAMPPESNGLHAEVAGVEQLPLTERPGWLLRRLAHRLQRLGRLPAAPAMTARELARGARLDTEADRESLCEVALAAERVRYAAVTPQATELEAVVGAGQGLLQRLESAPAPVPAPIPDVGAQR